MGGGSKTDLEVGRSHPSMNSMVSFSRASMRFAADVALDAVDVTVGAVERGVVEKAQTGCMNLQNDHRVLFQDKPYLFDDWEASRTWRRYKEGLRPDVAIRVAVGLWPPLLANLVISLLVCSLCEWTNLLDGIKTNLEIAWPFQLTLFAVSLLLVFKTNSAYNRWWDGRKMWGAMYNQVRGFVRKIYAWVPDPEHKETVDMLVRWMAATPYLINAYLDPQKPLRPMMVGLLHEHEIDWVDDSGHYMLAAGHMLTALLAQIPLEPNKHICLELDITTLMNLGGGCERIQRQAIPVAYTRNTTRFLSIWLHLLPIAMYSHIQWATVFACPLIAFLLLGVEHIGAQLENPFLVLSQDIFCLNIHKNTQLMVEAQERGDGETGTVIGDVIATSRTMVDNKIPPPPNKAAQKTTRFERKAREFHKGAAPKFSAPSYNAHLTNTDFEWFPTQEPEDEEVTPKRHRSSRKLSRNSSRASSKAGGKGEKVNAGVAVHSHADAQAHMHSSDSADPLVSKQETVEMPEVVIDMPDTPAMSSSDTMGKTQSHGSTGNRKKHAHFALPGDEGEDADDGVDFHLAGAPRPLQVPAGSPDGSPSGSAIDGDGRRPQAASPGAAPLRGALHSPGALKKSGSVKKARPERVHFGVPDDSYPVADDSYPV